MLALISVLLGIGAGAFRKINLGRSLAVSQVKDSLRSARLFAIEQSAAARVDLDLDENRLLASGMIGVGNWHFEDERGWPTPVELRGGATLVEHGAVGRAFFVPADDIGSANLGRSPSFNGTQGFFVEAFVQVAPGIEAPFLKKGQAFELSVTSDLGIAARVRCREKGLLGAGDAEMLTLVQSGCLLSDRWTRVGVSFDGTQIQLFIDGRLRATQRAEEPLPHWPDPDGDLVVGSSSPAFLGGVDEVRLAVVSVSRSEPLPEGVTFAGPVTVHFDGRGRLDPTRHAEPATVTLLVWRDRRPRRLGRPDGRDPMSDPNRAARSERGVALMAVIAVLMALIVIATPFSISMQNQDRSASLQTFQTKTQKSTWAALSMAEEALTSTAPLADETPYVDTNDELRVDLGRFASRYGAEVNDPRGSIWSVRVEDEQGKVDVNRSSPYLLGNVIGAAVLSDELEADVVTELSVDSTAGFPDQGIVWIHGEIILYRSKTERTFNDLERAFDTSVLKSRAAGRHEIGASALDYRVILAAIRPYKVKPDAFIDYPSVRGIKDIAAFGEMSFFAEELDAWEPDLTAFAPTGAARFSGGARTIVASDALEGEEPTLVVIGGRHLGPGTVVRVRTDDWRHVEYNLVARAAEVGVDRYALTLQEALQHDYDEDEAIVEGLTRAPVNVNTCSRRVLAALIQGVTFPGQRPLTASGAAAVADQLFAARPIDGFKGLDALLVAFEQAGVLDPRRRQREALLLNSLDPGDSRLVAGTAPFAYRSHGTVAIEAAVSENLEAGREASRLFAREVTQVRKAGEQVTLLSTQRDFFDAMRNSRSGKYWTTFPGNLIAPDGLHQPPVAQRSFMQRGVFPHQGTDQTALAEAYARLAPVRKHGFRDATAMSAGVDRVLRFDDRRQGYEHLDSEYVDGWDVAEQGPVRLDVGSELVNLLNARDWVWPFCFEGWFTFHEGSGEAILFDAGEEPIKNRIFAFFDSQTETLVFRVADGTVPDYESGFNAGNPGDELPLTQMAEIRYQFDDGLPFEEDVPYHLTFYARGSKPGDLVLLVDGVPRGRRAFMTRLRNDLSAPPENNPFANIQGYAPGRNQTIPVVDADLFPPEGTVLVGGNEIVEYNSKTDDELVISPTTGDPFGGRAARGSVGRNHYETESVELYGYAAILTSRLIPTGNLTISSPMPEFGVAMVDPNAQEAKTNIAAIPSAAPPGSQGANIGIGLDANATTISVTRLSKPTVAGFTGDVEFFNEDGGFALIVSSPLPPPSNGADLEIPVIAAGGAAELVEVSWGRPFQVDNNTYVGMAELIHYSGFDNNQLTGVTRSGASFLDQTGPWEPQSNLAAGEQMAPVDHFAIRAHAHISRWQIQSSHPDANDHDPAQPIFVVPISVGVGFGVTDLATKYPVPELLGGGGGRGGGGGSGNNTTLQTGTRPEMVQLGLDWTGGSEGGTEWVRYDTIAKGQFVRDHPARLRLLAFAMGRVLCERYTAKNGTPPADTAVATALNFEAIQGTIDQAQAVAAQAGLSEELVAGSYPGAGAGGGMLAFRGVLGTGANKHPEGDPILPVFRTLRGDVHTARPGPRDFVTLIDPDASQTEEHRINYAYSVPDVEGWFGAACHVALDSHVTSEYYANIQEMFAEVDAEDPDAAFNALQNANVESRDFTRMLKFPSGELPVSAGEELLLGADFEGTPSPRGFTVDEMEFFNPDTPSPALPRHPRYVLSREIDDSGKLYLSASRLRYNMWDRASAAIEALEPVAMLPTDGVVLLVGEELIAVSEIIFDPEEDQEAELEVAVNGRGYLGTPIQVHRAGSAVREMTFLRVSRLERSIDEDARELRIADETDFAHRGVVQMGRELIGYSRREEGALVMPEWIDPTGHKVGLLRGRYGTTPTAHASGTLVYQFPVRHEDRYRPQADDPELGYVGVHLEAKNAFYKGLTWSTEGETELADVVVQARVGGRGRFTDAPSSSPDLFEFTASGFGTPDKRILRQGDTLELRAFTRYKAGAFDGQVFDPDVGSGRGGSNDWKRAPRLLLLGVDWIGGPARLTYEEWR